MMSEIPILSYFFTHDNSLIILGLVLFVLLFCLLRYRNIRRNNLTIKSFWTVFGVKMTNISRALLSTEVINHLESSSKNLQIICTADMHSINKAYTSKPLHYLFNIADITIPVGGITNIAARVNSAYGSQHRSIEKLFKFIAPIINSHSSNTCLVTTNEKYINFANSLLSSEDNEHKLHVFNLNENNDLNYLNKYLTKISAMSLITTSLDADTNIEIKNIASENNIKLMLAIGDSSESLSKSGILFKILNAFILLSRCFRDRIVNFINPSTIHSREYLNPAGISNSLAYGEAYRETFLRRLGRKQWHSKVLFKHYLKRSFDIAVSTMALILLGPLLLCTALAIRIESAGPIFFKQVRVGYKGKAFTMYKFRSMFIDAEERLAEIQKDNESGGGVLFKMKKDPRITRIGRVIRKLSIDELPQIINVFNGDMSIVGPRPALPSEVSKYQTTDRKRLQTKPGLTCLWQIGGRSDLSFEQQIELDIKYLSKKSLTEDIAIVVKTVPAVISGKGAY